MTTKPFRLVCKECGRRYKAAVECPNCGATYPIHDPKLELLTRERLTLKFRAEARWLRSTHDVDVSIWIGDSQHRRRRAAAAKGYSAGHLWPPIPDWANPAHHREAPDDHDPLSAVLDQLDRALDLDDPDVTRQMSRKRDRKR